MRNIVFIIFIVLVLIGVVVYASGHTTQKNISAQKQTFTLVVKNNHLVSGTNNPQVEKGDNVTFAITADVAGELHLHGYDKHINFNKDKQAKLSFTARLTGHFPYELEDTKTEIGALDVLPN